MSECEGFWNCVSPDAWVTSMGTVLGAFIGTLLAGLIAAKRAKKESAEDITVTYIKVESNLIYIINHFEKFIKNPKDKILLSKIKTLESKKISYLSQINKTKIPANLIIDFENIELSLNQLFNYHTLYEVIPGMMSSSRSNIEQAESFLDILRSSKKSIDKELRTKNFK